VTVKTEMLGVAVHSNWNYEFSWQFDCEC
jgi:hypothetical protein